jgi:hypothetical protein
VGTAKIAVVIPCFNTSSACLGVIQRTLAVTGAVLAVDDGSTDDTPDCLKASGIRSIRLPRNAGKGAALRTGIAEVLKGRDGILGGSFDYIVTLDGDGQHIPDDIPRLIACAQRQDADLVVAARNTRVMPPKSRFGNSVSRMLFFLGTGHYVPDTQSGFRLLSTRLASALLDAVSWRRYETEAEILSKAVTLGYNVATVEIPTIYFDGNRRTHFDPLWDSIRVFAVLGRTTLTSLAITALDIVAFLLSLAYVTPSLVRANLLARAVALVAHVVLRRNTVPRGSGMGGVARYAIAQGSNLVVTTGLLVILEPSLGSPLAAKIAAHVIGFAFSIHVARRRVSRWRRGRDSAPARPVIETPRGRNVGGNSGAARRAARL